MTKKLSVPTVAKQIHIPVSRWSGNCFAIATAMVNAGIVKGLPRYGHFLGDIHPDSMFYSHSVAGFVRHGWIEMPNGTIVDPTRYVFEHKPPYIYVGENDFYDVGGSSLRDAMRATQTPPAFNADEGVVILNLPDDTLQVLHIIAKDKRSGKKFSKSQVFWLGNANPFEFGEHAKKVYTALEKTGWDATIPIDYWNLIMETN